MLDFGFYNMDCLEGMKQFPDKFFDLAIVDPPYGDAGGGRKTEVHCIRNGGKWCRQDGRKMGGEIRKKIVAWDVAPEQEYFDELFRVSRNQIIWGGNYFTLPPTRCFIVWRKTNVPEAFTMAMCEYAWTSFNTNAKWIELPATGQVGRFHPTQKPVELYEWILNNYAEHNDVILDTHCGSASSLVACHKTQHKFVGFEIDEEYFKQADARLKAEQAQMTIYDFLGFNPYQE